MKQRSSCRASSPQKRKHDGKPGSSKRAHLFDNPNPDVYNTERANTTNPSVGGEEPSSNHFAEHAGDEPSSNGSNGNGGGVGAPNNQYFKGFGKPNKRGNVKVYSVTRRFEKLTVFSSLHNNDRKGIIQRKADHWSHVKFNSSVQS